MSWIIVRALRPGWDGRNRANDRVFATEREAAIYRERYLYRDMWDLEEDPSLIRLIGGPMDGEGEQWGADLVELAEYPTMAYHRTHISTGTDPKLDWWAMNLSEPTWETVYQWRERGWVSPAIQAIRDAVSEAAQ